MECQGAELEASGLEDAISELQLEPRELPETQTDLGEDLDSHATPLIRHPKIHGLPDELLLQIYGNLRKLDDIKNLRLSSKRLCNTSSHLLMDTLHVSPNQKSLERLDAVSRHETISKGIRRLVVSVDVYHADFAHDAKSFARRCIEELQELVPRRHPGNQEGVQFLKSWVAFVETSSDAYKDGKRINEHHISAVHRGWVRYRRLLFEQKTALHTGRFSLGIAAAIDRMVHLDDVVIRDRSRSCADSQPGSQSIDRNLEIEELTTDPTRLVEEMMLHTLSWQKARVREVENPPTHLLYQIPLAIHNAGASLAHLRFDLTAPRSFQLQMDSEEMSQLRAFAKGLKSFKFSVRPEPRGYQRPVRNAQEKEDLLKFLTAFKGSKKLDSVALDFAFQERYCSHPNRLHDPTRTSIGPLLVDWDQPQNIHLKNCSMTLAELRIFVRLPRKKPAVLGLWYVYLLDGKWADAVEFIRSAILRGRLSQESVSNLLTSLNFPLVNIIP